MEDLQGQRTTSQRRLLLDLLHQMGGHLDADELHHLAREKEPRISLSTVYRTLRLLKELGLVDERHLAEEHHHYEAKGEKEHHHLICLSCGKVIEFEHPLTAKIRQDVSQDTGFEVVTTDLHMEGYCKGCRRRTD